LGHQHLGGLPATRQWQAVIELIAGGADVSEIAAASSNAAQASLAAYSDDPTVRHAFFLLTQIPLAAKQRDFAAALRRLGLQVDRPDLVHISAACLDAIDRHSIAHRSDLGEMVALSAVESLQAVARCSLDDLFGTNGDSPDRTREVLAGLATVKQFGILAQDFFARLLRRHLAYYLSRQLPKHVGVAERFPTLREHSDFDDALELHCREAARIVTRFAGEWHSKNTFEGGITQKKAGGFIHVAMEKLRKELGIRSSARAA
jgi:hypothetical protein